jgi:hypothetical protein
LLTGETRLSRRLLASLLVGSVLLVVSVLAAPVGAVQSTAPSSRVRADWSIVPSPNTGSGLNQQLNGVSCVRSRSCVAVGLYTRGGVDQTLVESRQGPWWSIVASPNAGTSDNAFNGVSCASARWCVAVGFYKANGVYQTLIESWNGVRWSIVPSPNFGTVNNLLEGVSCASAKSCQAVGWDFDSTNGVESTLIESWNGSGWSIVPSPNRALAGNILVSVSCVASTSCKAVGYTIPNNQPPVYETLVESWNGVGWSIVPSPNQPTSASLLLGVSCVSANVCEAVGEYNVGQGNYETLIESWNGTNWTIVPSPNGGTNMTGLRTDVNGLLAVSCTSARACEAVGLYFNVGLANYQTLIESWNGISWSLASSPNRAADGYNVLASVSCPQRLSSCTAVGNYFDTTVNAYQTLIETNG